MPRPLRVLIVEDNPADAELIVRELRRAGFSPDWSRVDTEAAYAAGLDPAFDIILSDFQLPQFSGLRALEVRRERGLEIPFIIVSGTIGEETAVAAMKQGAEDYLLKDRLGRLGPAVEQALEKGRLHREQTRTQAALAASERRFRQLADAMPQIVWATRPDGGVDYFNHRWYEFTCRQEGGEGEYDWAPVMHPDDLPFCREMWQASVQSGQPYQIEHRLLDRRTGEYRWHLGRALPVRDDQGNITRWFGTATDIHSLKMAQQEMRELNETLERRVRHRTAELQAAKERAESTDRLKSEFLANMSHELRTPLNGVLGFTEFLVDEKAGPLNAGQKEYLTDVHNSGSHLLRLINDVLDLAKVESGRSDLSVETFAPGTAIQEVCAVVKGIANKKRVNLKVAVAPGLAEVSLDEKKFKQICYNLLSNAVKFSEAGSQVGNRRGCARARVVRNRGRRSGHRDQGRRPAPALS